jgi:hypothetical protein
LHGQSGARLFIEYRCFSVSSNAGKAKPAKLLAVFVVDERDGTEDLLALRFREIRWPHKMPAATVYGSPKARGKTMVQTYRDVAIEQMIVTVEEAMSQVLDYWGDLPPSMKEAVEQFRSRLGAAIDSAEFVKRALDRCVHETDHGKGPA